MATILFLSANPSDSQRLRIDEEIRAVDQALRNADPSAENVSLVQWSEVSGRELPDMLLRYRPHVVHFSGHGDKSGRLALSDGDDRSRPLSIEAIARLFAVLKDRLKCVVLNACYSDGTAAALCEHIDVVVGMRREVDDTAAIRFSAGFYQGLGHGLSVRSAFELGRAQVQVEGLGAAREPRMRKRRGVDPGKLRIVAERGSLDAEPVARRAEPDDAMGPARLEAYVKLGRCLKPLARYDREQRLTAAVLSQVSSSLRDWYFEQGGWLFLPEQCRPFYFKLKDSLKVAIAAGKRRRAAGGSSQIVIRDASVLRRAIRGTAQ